MKKPRGFADPTYMILLAAVLIVLAIAIPPLARRRERSRNLKALATLRAAIARHAADTKTKGPIDLTDLTKSGKYLAELPVIGLASIHARSARVGAFVDDAGGWAYSSWPGAPDEGTVRFNCTHTDTRGTSWSAY